MKKLLLALAVAGTALTATATTAQAREGCGPGFHRGPYGRCLANRGPAGPAWVVGRFYHGRGYWDGRSWYQHRDRRGAGWRYY